MNIYPWYLVLSSFYFILVGFRHSCSRPVALWIWPFPVFLLLLALSWLLALSFFPVALLLVVPVVGCPRSLRYYPCYAPWISCFRGRVFGSVRTLGVQSGGSGFPVSYFPDSSGVREKGGVS